MTKTFKAVVAGTGSYLPEKILTNKDLEKTLETSDAWITERTGISERRIAAEDESASTMAARAGKQALEAGSDCLIIGRPITKGDPKKNIRKILNIINYYYSYKNL